MPHACRTLRLLRGTPAVHRTCAPQTTFLPPSAQDENRNPAAGKRAAPGTIPLSLHALDLLGGTWAELRTSGAPGFEHLEALVVVGSRLVAVGWRAPRGGRKEDTPMQARRGVMGRRRGVGLRRICCIAACGDAHSALWMVAARLADDATMRTPEATRLDPS